jgi:hypothetical protein
MATNFKSAQEGSVSSIAGKQLAQAQLTTSAAIVYTVPASSVTKIENATVTNITATPATVTIHVVPSGGSVANTNAVEFARSIAANTSVQLTSLIGYQNAGATIRALAGTATALNLTLNGTENS